MLKAWFSAGAVRTRWCAFGAAVAVAVAGSGGLLSVNAADSPSASMFTAISPCRILDTRASSPIGGRSTPLGAAETYSITTFGKNGNCTLPSTVTALTLNVTAVGPTDSSYLTVFPAGGSVPNASNLNLSKGQGAVPNAVTVAVAADGRISLYNDAGSVNVLVDVVGYFAAPSTVRVSEVYSAAAYKLATDGCPAGQVRVVRSREWGSAGVLPAEMPCVAMPVWNDYTGQIEGVVWLAPVAGVVPAGVRVAPDPSVVLALPVVNGTQVFFGCQVVPAAELTLVTCQMLPQGPATAYPFNSQAAAAALISAKVESNAVVLNQYT